MNSIVIVPGFAESKHHFSKLIQLLELKGYKIKVVMPWRTDIIESYKNSAVFIGHSLGAYCIAEQKLVPSLLIGLPDPVLVKKYFGKSFLKVTSSSLKKQHVLTHTSFRIANLATIIANFAPLLKFTNIKPN